MLLGFSLYRGNLNRVLLTPDNSTAAIVQAMPQLNTSPQIRKIFDSIAP
jgi:hypothetical protein